MEGGISKMVYMTRLRGADLTLAERAVLTVLWTYTNADLENAYPSRMRLAADSGVSRDGVRKALRGLEDKGYIAAVSRGGWTDEGNRANVYDLTLPRGASEKPTGGYSDTPPGATEKPLSDPSSDPSSDPLDTADAGASSQTSSTGDPDGSTHRDSSKDEGGLSPAERADPISPDFHRSQDRKFLLKGVQTIAQNRADGDTEKLEHNLGQFTYALNVFFDRDEQWIWGVDYGWEDIPKKCTSPYEAGKWLNTFLNSWQQEEGPLEWTPYTWQEAS